MWYKSQALCWINGYVWMSCFKFSIKIFAHIAFHFVYISDKNDAFSKIWCPIKGHIYGFVKDCIISNVVAGGDTITAFLY